MMLKTFIDDRGVATLSLNRPEIHNAFNDEMIDKITSQFLSWEKNDLVRLVLIKGEGKSFCAGADLNWMKKMLDYSHAENIQDSKKLAKMFKVMNEFEKPLIGKIQGHALGGGSGILAVCDYVILMDRSKIGFTETRLGLVPAVISPYVLSKIGESYARATFLSGKPFSAKKALEMGLAHQVCSEDEIEKVTDQVIDDFLLAAPKAVKIAKKLIKNVIAMKNSKEDDLSFYTCEVIASQRISAEGQEGMSALLEKRKPVWAN